MFNASASLGYVAGTLLGDIYLVEQLGRRSKMRNGKKDDSERTKRRQNESYTIR